MEDQQSVTDINLLNGSRTIRLTNSYYLVFDLPYTGQAPQLTADGTSQTTARVTGLTGVPLTWSLINAPPGCRLDTNSVGDTAIVTAGTKEGTVTVQAQYGGCTYQGELELVSCSSCPEGSCESLGSGEALNESVYFKLHLGRDSFDRDSGYLYILTFWR